MTRNKNLTSAERAKNDEIYTQFNDIQHELNCYIDYDKNIFRDKTSLKKIISTSYAVDSKKINFNPQITFFEMESPNFNEEITNSRGKIFTLDRESIKTKNYLPTLCNLIILKAMEIFAATK